MKHISGKSNKVVDDLSRRKSLIIEMKVETVYFDYLKTLYKDDLDFAKPSKACMYHLTAEKYKWIDYFIQDDMLFKGIQLFIPRGYMRGNIIKEKHSGGLVVHFGIDKKPKLIAKRYY